MTRTVFFRDYTGAEFGIDTPLTRNIDLNEIKHSLSIPTFVNTESYVMERAILTIYAAANAHKVHDFHPNLDMKDFGPTPIPALLFGGIAIRMHSPSSNAPGNPFHREPNDIDLIVPRKRGVQLVNLLQRLGEIYGTRYHYFVTASDKTFNALRGGERFRVRTIERIAEDGAPIPGVLDILTDCIDLRHKVDVADDFNHTQQRYTISLANILLSKCQYIFDVPRSQMSRISEEDLDYRVLNYSPFKSDRIVMGMEEKDIKDVCAILADNPVGENSDSIEVTRINEVLEHDKKFALTFKLNLQNILEKPEILEGMNIDRSTISIIMTGIERILQAVPVINKEWSKPWWNTEVETPEIFGKAKSN
jgi:hypothetical protein